MLKLLNKGEYYAAAKEFDRWIYEGWKVSDGLGKTQKRREGIIFDIDKGMNMREITFDFSVHSKKQTFGLGLKAFLFNGFNNELKAMND